jgi:membrane-associated phospholipid phosphatase
VYEYPRTSRRTIVLVTILWLAAVAVGFLVDRTVAAHFADDNSYKHLPLSVILKMPGEFYVAVAVLAALWTWHPTHWRAAGHLALSALLGGIIYALLKWFVGRTRPDKGIDAFAFDWFKNGWKGLLQPENLSFPSGHTTMAFAMAACLAINLPRWRYPFYLWAALCGVERVTENAHYVSDVLVGAGVGTLSAYLVHWAERALAARTMRKESDALPLMGSSQHAGV